MVGVVTRDHVDPIVDRLLPILNTCSGVVLITEVQVLRGEHFVPGVKAQIGRPAFR